MKENAFIDIHSHILPGVDDGAGTLEESLEMLRQAQRENIGAIVLTPHQKPGRRCLTADKVKEKISLLKEEWKNSRSLWSFTPVGNCFTAMIW